MDRVPGSLLWGPRHLGPLRGHYSGAFAWSQKWRRRAVVVERSSPLEITSYGRLRFLRALPQSARVRPQCLVGTAGARPSCARPRAPRDVVAFCQDHEKAVAAPIQQLTQTLAGSARKVFMREG